MSRKPFISFVIVTIGIAFLGIFGTVNLDASFGQPYSQGDFSALRNVQIEDPVLHITAYRGQVPQNWKFEGVLLRDPACGSVAGVTYRASSPDGLTGEQLLPTFDWHWSDDPANVSIYRQAHCKIMMPMSATDFLNYVIPVLRPAATVVHIEPTMDAQQWDANIQLSNLQAQRMGIKTRMTGGAMRARLAYKMHGREVEDNFAVRMSCTQQQIGMYGGPVHRSWDCNASIISIRAPQGQLDTVMGNIASTAGSGLYTQEWLQASSQQIAKNGAQVQAWIHAQGQATAALMKSNHDQYMQEQQQRFDKSQQLDRERSAAMHNTALAYTLYAGDEQLVRNPGTGEVSRVTTKYGNNGWQDQTSGQILMSDDSNLNPNLYLRGEWSQLENVNPIKP